MNVRRRFPADLHRTSAMGILGTVAVLSLSMMASAFDASHWIEVSGGAWHPRANSLPGIEQVLRPAVVASRHGKRLPSWKDYTFQFQGRISPLGKQFIFINAFCDSPHYRLSETWVQVFDGGACYFSAKYDPEHDRIYDVVVNGEA